MTLEEKELEIINHYGVEAQLDYFPTEIFELVEAIKDYDCGDWYSDDENCKEIEKQMLDHIVEELADCEMMLDQFKLKFEYKGNKGFNVYSGKNSDALKYLFKDVGIFIQKVAIHEYEACNYDEPSEFLIEAIENIQEKLNFFKLNYIIDQRLINVIKVKKANRQLGRIKNEK